MCSDLFGLKHFAANYTTLQVRLLHTTHTGCAHICVGGTPRRHVLESWPCVVWHWLLPQRHLADLNQPIPGAAPCSMLLLVAPQFAPAAGSYLLATGLTGWLYDRAAAAHGDPHQCIGSDCFREAFLILSGLAGVTSIACSVATSRSRRAYQALAQHLRQVDIAEGNAHTSDQH